MQKAALYSCCTHKGICIVVMLDGHYSVKIFPLNSIYYFPAISTLYTCKQLTLDMTSSIWLHPIAFNKTTLSWLKLTLRSISMAIGCPNLWRKTMFKLVAIIHHPTYETVSRFGFDVNALFHGPQWPTHIKLSRGHHCIRLQFICLSWVTLL